MWYPGKHEIELLIEAFREDPVGVIICIAIIFSISYVMIMGI